MKKAFIGVLLFLVLIFGISVSTYFITISLTSRNTEPVVLVIQSGQGVADIAKQLKEKKLINNATLFKVYLFINGKSNAIQPGEYKFNQVNISKIVNVITVIPEKKPEITVTVLEGWNSQEVADYLQQQGLIMSSDFERIIASTDTRTFLPDKKFDFLSDKPLNAGLEGYIFPDTYRFFTDSTAAEIVDKMLDNFDRQLNPQLREDIRLKGMSIYETITLASIVEKEAKTAEDKKIVAGIFLNRLKIGQKLESDATVNFVTGKNTTRPSYVDIGTDSLYNTYIYSGLPVGPICAPGLEAIEAVIYPTNSDFLFFLNTPGGDVVYSKTYEEHLANKNKYYPE